MESDIYQRIPHRPPFLWVDKIISIDKSLIVTEKNLSPDLEIYKGHYPGYPITPGIILCEAIFQTGAILMSEHLSENTDDYAGVPVLTRICPGRYCGPSGFCRRGPREKDGLLRRRQPVRCH